MKIAHMFYRGFAVYNIVISIGTSFIFIYMSIFRGSPPTEVYYITCGMIISGLLSFFVLRKSWNLFLKESYSEKTELLDDLLTDQKAKTNYNYTALEVFFLLCSLAALCFMLYVCVETNIIRIRGIRDYANILALLYTVSWAFMVYHSIVLLRIRNKAA